MFKTYTLIACKQRAIPSPCPTTTGAGTVHRWQVPCGSLEFEAWPLSSAGSSSLGNGTPPSTSASTSAGASTGSHSASGSAWAGCGRSGLRVDSGVAEGDAVGVHYDPLVAKVGCGCTAWLRAGPCRCCSRRRAKWGRAGRTSHAQGDCPPLTQSPQTEQTGLMRLKSCRSSTRVLGWEGQAMRVRLPCYLHFERATACNEGDCPRPGQGGGAADAA